jgi:hypothetical protein
MKDYTDQIALTIIAEIREDSLEVLQETLKAINDNVGKPVGEKKSILDFDKDFIKGLHFCRFVILPTCEDLKGEKIPDQLVYSSNFDQSLDAHLSEITNPETLNGFVEIFSCCKTFDKTLPPEDAVKDFIRKNEKTVHAFYRGYQGLTVDIIKKEQELYKAIQEHLDEKSYAQMSPKAIKESIESYVAQHALLIQKATKIELGKWSQKLTLFYIGFRLLLPVVILWFIFYLFGIGLYGFLGIIALIIIGVIYLRILEKKDLVIREADVDYDKVTALTLMEDRIIQNQFSHVVFIKKGVFRRSLQWIGLWFLNTNVKLTDDVGNLSGITSIHFARWSMIDNGRRLIFFSNFDGTWENYLSDFVDRASKGLTLAWSNTERFPRTCFLIFKGATNETLFKSVARKNQVATNVWYSAYPTLTVKNIYRNHKIALGIGNEMTENEIKAWLKLF